MYNVLQFYKCLFRRLCYKPNLWEVATWETVTWEVALGKMSLGKYLRPIKYRIKIQIEEVILIKHAIHFWIHLLTFFYINTKTTLFKSKNIAIL